MAVFRLVRLVPTRRNLRSLQRQRSRHSIERSLRTARTNWRPAQPPQSSFARQAYNVLESLTIKIELMSACGTNRTCRGGLTMSVDCGVYRKWLADSQNDAIDPKQALWPSGKC